MQPTQAMSSAGPTSTGTAKLASGAPGSRYELASFDHPESAQTFPRCHLERVKVGGGVVGRATFEPGWKWSECIQPVAKTNLCQSDHMLYQISGTMRIRMENGDEFDSLPGTVCHIPAGHDAWVVGRENVVVVDFHAAVAAASALRPVDCTQAGLDINATQLQMYAFAFNTFEETATRQGKWMLIFEALDAFAGTSGGFVDLTEFRVALAGLEASLAPANVSIDTIVSLWRSQWVGLGTTLLSEAEGLKAAGDEVGASSAYFRASTYLFLAERIGTHTDAVSKGIYAQAVTAFQQGLNASDLPCLPVSVPYEQDGSSYQLHGYWCNANPRFENGKTIITVTGYDGTAEMLLQSVGLPASTHGFNALLIEGPGQGWVARFQGLQFRPDWEVVIDQVVSWASTAIAEFDPQSVIVWGRSFGGYLAPRAFSQRPTYLALVADGGVYDFFQALYCSLPTNLQQMLYTNASAFDATMDMAYKYSLSVRFLLDFGVLGFGSNNASSLFMALAEYSFVDGSLAGIGNRPVLVHNPSLDFQVKNQSALFWAHMPQPRSPASTLLQLDALRGAGLHCGVGSTAYVVNQQLSWLKSALSAMGL